MILAAFTRITRDFTVTARQKITKLVKKMTPHEGYIYFCCKMFFRARERIRDAGWHTAR